MILGPYYELLGFTVLRPGRQQLANRRPTHFPTPRIRQADLLPRHHAFPRHRTGLRVAGLAPDKPQGAETPVSTTVRHSGTYRLTTATATPDITHMSVTFASSAHTTSTNPSI